MRTNQRWTPEEWERTSGLLALHNRTAVARMIGRSRGCLVEKIRWEGMTEEQRQRRRDAVRRRRAAVKSGAVKVRTRKPRRPNTVPQAGQIKVCSDVLEERNARALLEPRDLTAAFFGDPLPGYSALERRA